MQSVGIIGAEIEKIRRRIRAADYLTVAQLFLQSNFLLERPLSFDDIKPRLLGHWGTCHGINTTYANLTHFYREYRAGTDLQFILGPGHGFPALNANLFLDGELAKVDPRATRNLSGIEYLCRNFSAPGGFPSHASPFTPGVIVEGGELGYALGAAFGAALGHSEKTVAVMLGDGEFETGTTLASMNLVKLIGQSEASGHGRVLPILHVNGYKISGPTVFARKSEREQKEMIRGFGFDPVVISGDDPNTWQIALGKCLGLSAPFIIFKSDKGATGPDEVAGQKVRGNYPAHQIPLPLAKSDTTQLSQLAEWLHSYHFEDLYIEGRGFQL